MRAEMAASAFVRLATGGKVKTSSAPSASPRDTEYRRVRFPGITRFAAEYGYNYVSVYRHLTGERPSKTIARKWDAWKAGRAS